MALHPILLKLVTVLGEDEVIKTRGGEKGISMLN